MINLDVKTRFSVRQGMGSSADLARASGAGSTLAITDRECLGGIYKHEKACKDHGVKPVFGATVSVGEAGEIVLLAESQEGMLSLYALSRHMPHRITYNHLEAHNKGLVVMTGNLNGLLPLSILRDDKPTFKHHFGRLMDIFGRDRLFLEKIDWGLREHAKINVAFDMLSRRASLRTVTTNDAHYVSQKDAKWHGLLVCDGLGRQAAEDVVLGHGVTSAYLRDLPYDPVAHELAERCGGVQVPKFKPLLPRFADNEAELLRRMSAEGLDRLFNGAPSRAYRERLDYELDIIIRMGFASYYLIVSDFVQWARRQSIPVGAGRGSGGGSLAAWCVGITALDPVANDLYFERFLNPERVSMPDFDVDFGSTRREEVVDYVRNKYGHDRVVTIATYGEYKVKEAWKAACRVLDIDAVIANDFSKRYLKDILTFDQVLSNDTIMQAVRRIRSGHAALDAAQHLFGCFKSIGAHPAGAIILDRPAHEVVPITRFGYTQFDMKDAESVGCVKNDILGLKEVEAVHEANAMLDFRYDVDNLPKNDPKTLDLLCRGSLVGTFQVSGAMSSFVRLFEPRDEDDVALVISLHRPGPMDSDVGMHLEAARRRHGKSPITFPHPDLEETLKSTLGIMAYQEQVMRIGQIVGGLTLGGADLMRRAIGKKDKDLLDKQRAVFVEGGVGRGYDRDFCENLWKSIETFAGYGFNRSHGVGYAKLTIQTAFFKAHHPAEFMAAQCKVRGPESRDSLIEMLSDIQRIGLDVVWPDVQSSPVEFYGSDGKVHYGLAALSGVSKELAELIFWKRPYRNLYDFMRKIRPDSKAFTSLLRSGALDCLLLPQNMPLEVQRKSAQVAYPTLLHRFKKIAETVKLHDVQMPLIEDQAFLPFVGKQAAAGSDWSYWLGRRAAVGAWTDGHPIDSWTELIQHMPGRQIVNISDLPNCLGKRVDVLVAVTGWETFQAINWRGDFTERARVELDDPTGCVEVHWFNKPQIDLISKTGPTRITLDVDTWDDRVSCKIVSVAAVDANGRTIYDAPEELPKRTKKRA